MPFLDIEEVRERASGNWIEIFEHFAFDELEEALDKIGRHVDCPFHPPEGDGTKDFRLDYNVNENGRAFCTCQYFDGFQIIMEARRWDFIATLREISRFIGGEPSGNSWRREPDREEIKRRQLKKEAMAEKQRLKHKRAKTNIKQILDQCKSNHPRAIEYFHHRGIDVKNIPNNILYHPGLPYWYQNEYNEDTMFYLPALVCLFQTVDGNWVNILRIYLSKKNMGKAEVDSPKKQWTPIKPNGMKGAAIRLDSPAKCIAIAEGVETAMAVRHVTKLPTWATGDTNGMKNLEIPEQVKHILIWADNDKKDAGINAAEFLHKRMMREKKIIPTILLPERDENRRSRDWLDVLNEEGEQAFRNAIKHPDELPPF